MVLLLELTLPTPAANVALDEALLLEADGADSPRELLRFWSPHTPFVALGRSSQAAVEAKLPACRALDVPVLRRVSGGGAVVGGPGCLMYSLILDGARRPEMRMVDSAHAAVLRVLREALSAQALGVVQRGLSDLCLGDRKFSGNSMKIARRCVLYHGTIMHAFDLELIERCLGAPPREPDYRQGRGHLDFVMNLPIDVAAAQEAIALRWRADEPAADWPLDRVERLIQEKYSRDAWNLRH